LLLQY